MALSAPAPRRAMHTRRIVCEGWLRDDGLWDIEASIVDTKAYAYREPERGHREIGSPVHDMSVRLTIDTGMVVRAIEVSMNQHPYQVCLGAPPAFQGLVGQRVGPGWRKAVQACVGGVRGCTHVRELLFPMATVAFQTLSGWPVDDGTDQPVRVDGESTGFLDGCTAWDRRGEMVARLYPHWALPARGEGEGEAQG